MKRVPIIIRACVVAGLALQLTWFGLLWSRMMRGGESYRPYDFSAFYTAGRIAASGNVHQVFNIQAQLKIQEELLRQNLQVSQLISFNHPPLLLPILQWISTEDYMTFYWRWVIVLLGFVAASMFAINQLLRSLGWERGARGLLVFGSLLFYPIFVGLMQGQDSAFLLFGAFLWVYGLVSKKDAIAGLGLAMTLIRPQITLILAVPFLFNRRRVWWWFCGCATSLGIYSLALVGFEGFRDFLSLVMISANGLEVTINQPAMFNFTGLLLRLFPGLDLKAVHITAWGLFFATIIGLSAWWRISPEIHYRHITLMVSLSLFMTPHLNYHDLALLLIPNICLVIVLVSSGRLARQHAVILPELASMILLFSEFWDPARFAAPYLLMGVLPALTWLVETRMKKVVSQ